MLKHHSYPKTCEYLRHFAVIERSWLGSADAILTRSADSCQQPYLICIDQSHFYGGIFINEI